VPDSAFETAFLNQSDKVKKIALPGKKGLRFSRESAKGPE